MASFTDQQLAALIKVAGVTDEDDIMTMAHIAACESSRDSNKVNRNSNGTIDVGLWQINSVHLKDNPSWTEEWLKVPGNNALAAAALYRNRKFEDWNASKSCWGGKKESWLTSWAPDFADLTNWIPGLKNQTNEEIKNTLIPGKFWGELGESTDIPIISDTAKAIDATTDATVTIAEAVVKSAKWLSNPRSALRIAYVVVGSAVIITGLAKLIGYDSGLAPVKSLQALGKGSPPEKPAPEPKPIRTGSTSTLPKHHPARNP